jgi:hypothetical protein
LVSCFTKPPHRFRIVLRHAAALRKHDPQVELRGRVPLVSCLSKPPRRFNEALRHAEALEKHVP